MSAEALKLASAESRLGRSKCCVSPSECYCSPNENNYVHKVFPTSWVSAFFGKGTSRGPREGRKEKRVSALTAAIGSLVRRLGRMQLDDGCISALQHAKDTNTTGLVGHSLEISNGRTVTPEV